MNASSHSDGALSRRATLKMLATGAAAFGAVAYVSALSAATLKSKSSVPLTFDLPPLPYAFDALEPHFDAKTLEIHHGKHHAAYISNSKKLLEGHPDLLALGADVLVASLDRVPEPIRAGIRNNAGGHVNHAFFWKLLTPAGSTANAISAAPALQAEILKTFGSLDAFKAQFADAAAKRFGSGWTWLSVKPSGTLLIHSTANQDSPLSEGLLPIVGLDVWEHAYYLKYQNRRVDYVTAFWSVLNWSQAATNYAAALG